LKKAFFVFLLSISLLALAGCGNKGAAEYRADLQSVSDDLLDNSADAETILNQYAGVWIFSIESGTAIGVEEMSLGIGLDEDVIREHFELNSAGNVPGDFSTNINSLKSYYQATGELDEIEEASDQIKDKITELNNPPDEYEKVYDEVLGMYTDAEEFLEMILNPSGSLQSFNEDRNRLSSDILSKHKRIEAIMPSEK